MVSFARDFRTVSYVADYSYGKQLTLVAEGHATDVIVAWSVHLYVHLYVCRSHAALLKLLDRFGRHTHVVPSNIVLDSVSSPESPPTGRGDLGSEPNATDCQIWPLF